jgi:hypothetical protein
MLSSRLNSILVYKGIDSLAKLNSVLARRPEPNAGVARHVRWAAYLALDFFGSFLYQDKKNVMSIGARLFTSYYCENISILIGILRGKKWSKHNEALTRRL